MNLTYREPYVDHREGDYFVSAVDAGRLALASGPYVTHEEAIQEIPRVEKLVGRVDMKSWFYAWGTVRMEKGSGRIGFIQRHGLNEETPDTRSVPILPKRMDVGSDVEEL